MSQHSYGTPEYPAALLDPRTCAQTLLHQLYTQATRPHPDRDQRDRDIFRCHQIGKSAEVLDKAFGLSVQQIRKIIRSGRCGR